ncbi:MAG TPA: DUF1844 domain-containing protein [Candidatus Udaeobacter sp.]|jgi:hypothetical protein
MAEVQKTVQSGELTQRFIEFVMMTAQNAALFLGQIPNPKTGEPEVNLDLARMFIDQLEMIQEKTRGNLTNEETMVLRNTLSNLQMAFVEASGSVPPLGAQEPGAAQPPKDFGARPGEGAPEAGHEQPAEQPSSSAPEQSPPVASSEPEPESRKKFTKSYGP